MSNIIKKSNMFSALKESVSDGTLNNDSYAAVKAAIKGLVKESIKDVVDLAFKAFNNGVIDKDRLEEIISIIPQNGYKYTENLTIVKNDANIKLNEFKINLLRENEYKPMVKSKA